MHHVSLCLRNVYEIGNGLYGAWLYVFVITWNAGMLHPCKYDGFVNFNFPHSCKCASESAFECLKLWMLLTGLQRGVAWSCSPKVCWQAMHCPSGKITASPSSSTSGVTPSASFTGSGSMVESKDALGKSKVAQHTVSPKRDNGQRHTHTLQDVEPQCNCLRLLVSDASLSALGIDYQLQIPQVCNHPEQHIKYGNVKYDITSHDMTDSLLSSVSLAKEWQNHHQNMVKHLRHEALEKLADQSNNTPSIPKQHLLSRSGSVPTTFWFKHQDPCWPSPLRATAGTIQDANQGVNNIQMPSVSNWKEHCQVKLWAKLNSHQNQKFGWSLLTYQLSKSSKATSASVGTLQEPLSSNLHLEWTGSWGPVWPPLAVAPGGYQTANESALHQNLKSQHQHGTFQKDLVLVQDVDCGFDQKMVSRRMEQLSHVDVLTLRGERAFQVTTVGGHQTR